jgi:CRISPR/Cas system CSM-associated protein Csm3 (group 7 of RAMP superfamily)
MKRLDRHVLHLARFVLEARTALSIGTGGADGVYDHPIVRDANGLPLIPGTSLAGVLRHLWIMDRGGKETAANHLFGFQRRDRGDPSRLEVSACALHDSQGRPVEGLLLGDAGRKRIADDLLKRALATRDDPRFRDRVRIGHRGVTIQTGKFDRGVLIAGYRFSGELRLWSHAAEAPDWQMLLALLADPRLRLGGGTRAGLGAFKLIKLHTARFDLKQQEQVAAFARLGVSLADTKGLAEIPVNKLPGSPAPVSTLKIALDPRDFWRIGQGDQPLVRRDRVPDLLPKQEPMVTWDAAGRGSIGTRYALVPGSSVKGALAHRTAFHWNVLNGITVEKLIEEQGLTKLAEWDKSMDCDGVRALFGYAKDKDRAVGTAGEPTEPTGQAGHLLIDDASVTVTDNQVQTMIHNSIDRFTGGVRNRMLFTEELIYKRPFNLVITLLPGAERIDAQARQAFAQALRDLCEGHLALGAGTTKGHGAFAGTPDQPTRDWMKAQGVEFTAKGDKT